MDATTLNRLLTGLLMIAIGAFVLGELGSATLGVFEGITTSFEEATHG